MRIASSNGQVSPQHFNLKFENHIINIQPQLEVLERKADHETSSRTYLVTEPSGERFNFWWAQELELHAIEPTTFNLLPIRS